MPWELFRLVASILKKGVGGTCVDDLKSWHQVCRHARDAALECASKMVISANGTWPSLAQALHFFALAQKVEVTVCLGSAWVLEFSSLSPCLRERLAIVPSKVLRVQGLGATSSVTDTTRTALQRCTALSDVVVFDSLHVEASGACGDAAVRALTLALAGSLCKLVCCASPVLLDPDLYTVITRLEDVELMGDTAPGNTVPGLRAAGQLPRLRKVRCVVYSEEVWVELCKLTQLKELSATVLCTLSGDVLEELYSLNGLTHLRLCLDPRPKKEVEEFASGLLQHMPHLEDFSLVRPLRLWQPFSFRLPDGFRHGRLRRLSFCICLRRTAEQALLSVERWCPNLKEIIVNGRVNGAGREPRRV